MGAFLDKPNTRKLTQDGQILLRTGSGATGAAAEAHAAAASNNGAGAAATAGLPAAYLIKFGGSSMQGWRKYQEDRLSYMALREGRVPLANTPVPPAVPLSLPGINMIFLSIFDGHGGADTSQYSHIHFHPFLRNRVEKRMDEWNRECKRIAAAAAASDHSHHRRRRTGSSVIEHDHSESSLLSASSSSAQQLSFAMPAYPIDTTFLTAAFLDFDATIPLPQADNIPRNAPPPPPQQSGGMRKQQAVPPPEGNNIPHLASGTTATLCIIDLTNHQVAMAHIGDSRIVVFNSQTQREEEEAEMKKNRMSPVAEEGLTKSAKGSSGKKRKQRNSGASSAAAAASSSASPSSALIPRSSAASTASTAFSLLYASRDHHPDDPIERARIQARQFDTTFLNWQPPANSRICHMIQRISLNVVRGFGDAWFKLEENADQKQQMVSVEPDCWAVKFPLARGSSNGNGIRSKSLMRLESDAKQSEKKHNGAASSSSAAAAAAAAAPMPRPPSPADSRCTTPVLLQSASSLLPASAVLPPAGETLYIVLASDGIWNSEFPPDTEGVSIAHGSATAVKHSAQQISMYPPGVQAAVAAAAAARADRQARRHAHRRVAKEDANRGRPSDSEDEDEEDEDEDESDQSSDDEDYSDMAVNLAVAQYFYNKAQPIVEQIVQTKQTTPIAAAASSSAAAAAAAASPMTAPLSLKAKSPSSRLVAGRRSSSSDSASSAATLAAPASGPPSYSTLVSGALDLLMAHPPLTKANLKSTDNMSAWLISITPVGADALASMEGVDTGDENSLQAPPMSSPSAAAAAGFALDSKFAPPSSLSLLPSPRQSGVQRALTSTPSPATPKFFNQFTPPIVHQRSLPVTEQEGGVATSAAAAADAIAATPIGVRSASMPSNSPRKTTPVLPSGAPAAAVAAVAAAAAAAESSKGTHVMSPPRLKKSISGALIAPAAGRSGAAGGAAAAPSAGIIAPASASAHPAHPPHVQVRPAFGNGTGPPLMRAVSVTSNAPTPFLDDEDVAMEYADAAELTQVDRDDSPTPTSMTAAVAAAAPVPVAQPPVHGQGSNNSKKRRRSHSGAGAAANAAAAAGESNDLPPSSAPARVPSRARSEAVADLLFSDASIESQLSPSPVAAAAAAPVAALSEVRVATAPEPRVSARKRTAKSRKSKGLDAAAVATTAASESMSDLPSSSEGDEPAAAAAASVSASQSEKENEEPAISRKKKQKIQRRASSAAPPSKLAEPVAAAAAAAPAPPVPQSNRGTARSRKSAQGAAAGAGAGTLPPLQGVKAIAAAEEATTPTTAAAASAPAQRTSPRTSSPSSAPAAKARSSKKKAKGAAEAKQSQPEQQSRRRRASLPVLLPSIQQPPQPQPPAPTSALAASGRRGRGRPAAILAASSAASSVAAPPPAVPLSAATGSVQFGPSPPAITVLKSGTSLPAPPVAPAPIAQPLALPVIALSTKIRRNKKRAKTDK